MSGTGEIRPITHDVVMMIVSVNILALVSKSLETRKSVC
jgi:hypothetical protein